MNKKNLIKQGDSRKPISKLLSLILIALIIFIVGCGGSDSGDIKVPDPDDNDLPNDEEFDEMTHTYDEYPFLGAYVFVDPGANGQFTDGYNNDKSATFRELLDRQFETLANEITYRLLSVYGDGTILEDSKSIDFGSTSYKVNINKNQAIDDAVGELPAEIPNNLPLLGEEATTTWTTILLCEDTDPEDIRNSFELTNAILGGHPAINDGDEIGFDTTSNIAGAKWKVAGLSNEEIIRKIKLALLNSVAGLENNLDGNIALETIDHLGFTENDKQNILNAIQSEILGSPALAYDLDNKEAIKNTILYTANTLCFRESMVGAILSKVDALDIIYRYYLNDEDIDSGTVRGFLDSIADDVLTAHVNEHTQWLRAHEYKGYDVIIPSIIESAIEDGELYAKNGAGINTNIYSTLPRAQVLYMDIYTLQGTNKEEVENSQNGESEYDPEDDIQLVTLEKYLPDMNIISIVLLPNEVTGNPNKLVNGEIVPDTTVTVDGFLLESIDFAICGESGYNSTIYADFEIMAKGNKITKNGEDNFRSYPVEIYGDRIPENDDEAAYNVYTDLLPLDEIKDGTKSKEDYLIGGYNGQKLEDYGLSYTSATTEKGGSYKIYNLKTNTDFIEYNENGVNFNGGSNYIKINFVFTEIFEEADLGKVDNIVNEKVNTLLNILAFNLEVR